MQSSKVAASYRQEPMRFKVSLLVTASCITLLLVAVGFLRSTSQRSTDASLPSDAIALVTPLLQPSATPPQATPTDSVDALLNRPLSPRQSTITLNQRLSVDQSIKRVQQVDRVLSRVRQLTANDRAEPANPPPATAALITAETQSLNHNWVGSVAGTLKKQDYEIKKLEFELAQKQFKDGEIPKTLLDQKQANYQKSARELKSFINSFRMTD